MINNSATAEKRTTTDAISFRFGIPGFEYLTKFTIEDVPEYMPFKVLRAIEEPDISMLILDVRFIKIPAGFIVPIPELNKLGLKGMADDCKQIYVILRYDKSSQGFTANMKAPIVINFDKLVGQQIILENESLRSCIR